LGGKQTLANDRGRPVALAFLGHPKVATGSSVVATESKRSTDPFAARHRPHRDISAGPAGRLL